MATYMYDPSRRASGLPEAYCKEHELGLDPECASCKAVEEYFRVRALIATQLGWGD